MATLIRCQLSHDISIACGVRGGVLIPLCSGPTSVRDRPKYARRIARFPSGAILFHGETCFVSFNNSCGCLREMDRHQYSAMHCFCLFQVRVQQNGEVGDHSMDPRFYRRTIPNNGATARGPLLLLVYAKPLLLCVNGTCSCHGSWLALFCAYRCLVLCVEGQKEIFCLMSLPCSRLFLFLFMCVRRAGPCDVSIVRLGRPAIQSQL